MNVATPNYQVFEWDIPEYGHANAFRLSIRKGETPIHEEEYDGRKTSALTRVRFLPSSFDKNFPVTRDSCWELLLSGGGH